MTYEETLADVVLGEKQLEGKSVEGGVAADEQQEYEVAESPS